MLEAFRNMKSGRLLLALYTGTIEIDHIVWGLRMNEARTGRLFRGCSSFAAVRRTRLAPGLAATGRAASAAHAVYRIAVSQRSDDIVMDSGRGQFVDRNGAPLTGEMVQSLVAFPMYGMPRGTEKQLERFAEAWDASPEELKEWLRGVRDRR